MSVPVSRRTLSDLEFYNVAFQLRLNITNLLLRDFAIKDKIRNLSVLQGMRGMTDEDTKTLAEIAEKYGYDKPVIERYPYWLIDHFRETILGLLRDMMQNITGANTIYAISEREYQERRMLQTRAIINCEQLLQEMQYVAHVIPCDIEKFIPYVEMIEREIALLKGWRKSDNRILTQIREGKRRSASAKKAQG